MKHFLFVAVLFSGFAILLWHAQAGGHAGTQQPCGAEQNQVSVSNVLGSLARDNTPRPCGP